jgi:hypothetical protein
MKVSHCTIYLAASLLLLAACSKSAGPPVEVKEADAKPEHGLTLDKEQREKIGLATAHAAESSFLAESSGYGVVLGHEAIAVASAEVATAQAAMRQSRAALARTQQLAGTPGALPAETAENAERQAAANAAALTLAERRLTALLGQAAPLNGPPSEDGASLLTELATGQVKLVRATFPLGALSTAIPKRLRIARLDVTGNARNWTSTVIWDAPADATIPGRSFFTLLRASDVGEGERLQVWASTGATVRGATVPASAIVQSNSAYWCYIEKPEGSFTRTAIDTSRSVTGGYFVDEGVTAGDAVVTAGAGLLLARETNPSTAAE